MAITTWAATTGDWNDAKFSRPWDGPNISPAVGSLSLSTTAPSVNIEYFVSVGNANLEFIQSYEWNQISEAWEDVIGDWSSGMLPHVSVGTGISPAKADLTLSGSVPKAGIMYDFRISESTLTLTGILPAAGVGSTISPDNADLSIVDSYNWNTYGGTWANASHDWETAGSPYIPTAVETGQNQPDNADLTLTGVAPEVTKQQLWYIPTQDLTLSTTAPDAPIGPIFEPANADLTGSTSAPRAEETQHEGPAKADLTLTGQIPLASESHVRHVPVGETTLTGYIPLLGGNHFRTIGAGSLTGLGTTSWDDTSGDWASSSGTWGTGTLTPIPGITYTFPIDSGDEFVLTTGDPGWPLVRQPYYKPQVIMS